ncbi:exonuclease domain-containing protein [Patescibacteria group bacterium]
MKPFSNNIVFLDTEFSSLNPYKGEILSIGLVKMNGDELYLELEYDGEVDEWPKENVIPTLIETKVSREEAVDKIQKFIGEDNSRIVAYINNFDMPYLYKLFGLEKINKVFYWVPVDFASMLFVKGIDPESLVDWENKKDFFDSLEIDISKYKQHNALDDAKLLREVYLKVIGI